MRADQISRRSWLLGTVASFCLAPAAFAQTSEETLIDILESQGFEIQRVRRTWLGRIRILAVRDGSQREVVLNPANGAILRDYTRVVPTGSQEDQDSDNAASGNTATPTPNAPDASAGVKSPAALGSDRPSDSRPSPASREKPSGPRGGDGPRSRP